LKDVKQSSLDLFNKQTNALIVVKTIENKEKDKITEEMKKICKEIVDIIIFVDSHRDDYNQTIMASEYDVDLVFKSKLANEIVDLMKRIPVDQITDDFTLIILKINIFASYQQEHQLFEMGIIQAVFRALQCNDKVIDGRITDIIEMVIKPKPNTLKEGQQNPYLKQLINDGTVEKLSEIINNDNYSVFYHRKIAELIAYIFKAAPLPSDIKEKVVDQLRNGENDELCLLAECKDNHDAILTQTYQDKNGEIDR
ncbi:MAG: hypothetical protein EZS28_046120, partial [Streblomastix strix]